MKEITTDGIKILHFEELDSTNSEAMRCGELSHLSVITATRQSLGRGRLGRKFFSPDGGLYMSVVLDPEKVKCGLSFCTVAAALSVKEAILNVCQVKAELKWVNDLLLDGKKVCGILTEARNENGKVVRVVVGIGINLIRPSEDYPDDIKDRAAAINYTGDRNVLVAAIVKGIKKFTEYESEEIAGLYGSSLSSVGKHVEVTDYANPDTKLSGTVLGVDENCFLILKTDSGNTVTVSSGEILSK
jgi:BirA family biotin operon repressor/biotin-[acetyl-CoA-carboxylase] ligase